MTVRGYLMGPSADPQAAPTDNNYRWATVTDDSPLEIQLDGDALPLATAPDCLIDPLTLAPGDRVWVQLYGRRVIVHGAQGGGLGPHAFPNPWPNEQTTRLTPSGTSSTTSVTDIDWPIAHGGPLVISLTKRSATTRVIVGLNVTGQVDAGGGVAVWSVRTDTAVNGLVIWAYFNQANLRMSWGATYEFAGLPAGARTFTLRARTSGVSLSYWTDDYFTMTVREVAP